MQRLFWHFYLFIFLVLLALGWTVEQLWQQWQPAAEPPWLASYQTLLQQQLQGPATAWQALTQLEVTALNTHSISWLSAEQAQLEQGQLVSLFDDAKVYFYALRDGQLWQLGPLPLQQQDGAAWFSLLFFLLLAVAVALWLYPVTRDIRTLERSLQQPLTTPVLPARSFIAPIAERFLQMSQQIRSLLNLQQEMTHAVSHELRTPIARLSFALEMASQLPEQEKQLMLQDVRELQQLVDEILDYARLEAGQLPLQWQQVDLAELLLSLQEKLSPLPGAPIQLQLPPTVQLYGDGHYLERALQNLLVNAKKYAKQHIIVCVTQQKQYWQLKVEDDGPGVAPELREEIIKPFFRAEASRNKDSGGFGLGLAIVQRVAQWHQGSISVGASKLGGACFELRLPLRQS
ncbi:ATP-binding protein [Rheinheimera sp. FR7-31]|uniref:ATP-binding protein n=1 Tax=Rheinheimera fenheensis TaxID=3152295 RepID=UPI00325F2EC1